MPNIEITEDAMQYLKSLAEPFVDTPATVLDRIIADHQNGIARTDSLSASLDSKKAVYKAEQLPELLHTKIQSARIDRKIIARPKWKTLVVGMIEAAAAKGAKPEAIRSALKAYSVTGEKTGTGFEFVPSAGLSFQGLDANRSCEAALGLAAAFDIPIEIEFFWRDNEKAFEPGGTGRIEYP